MILGSAFFGLPVLAGFVLTERVELSASLFLVSRGLLAVAVARLGAMPLFFDLGRTSSKSESWLSVSKSLSDMSSES